MTDMSKELKALKLAHAVEKQIMQDNFDKCKAVAELRQWRCDQADKAMEDLKCCGNCVNHKQGQITGCSYKKGMSSNEYCDKWQTDGLNRGEREK
jgi:hypothetical protein